MSKLSPASVIWNVSVEHDAVERLVVAAGEGVVGGLDVDRGDVVGEQHDLVGVEFGRRTCGPGPRAG